MPHQKHPIVVALLDDNTAEIAVRGYVGSWNADVEAIEAQLAGRTIDRIRVRINTIGGSGFDGIAIHNLLREHPAQVEVIVEGVAGSAGSLVAMAGDEIVMYANALMMIHGARAVDEWGDEVQSEAARAMVEAFNAAQRETYRARTGMDDEALREFMTTNQWMTAREAVAAGFADRVQELTRENTAEAAPIASALFVIAQAAEIPADVLARAAAESAPAGQGEGAPGQPAASGQSEPAPQGQGDTPPAAGETFASQVHAMAKAHGLEAHAAAWLLDGQVQSIAQAHEAIAEAREVRDLCQFAGKPEAAARFIDARRSLADVRAELIRQRADSADWDHTDTHARPDPRTTPRSHHPEAITTHNIWAKRRTA